MVLALLECKFRAQGTLHTPPKPSTSLGQHFKNAKLCSVWQVSSKSVLAARFTWLQILPANCQRSFSSTFRLSDQSVSQTNFSDPNFRRSLKLTGVTMRCKLHVVSSRVKIAKHFPCLQKTRVDQTEEREISVIKVWKQACFLTLWISAWSKGGLRQFVTPGLVYLYWLRHLFLLFQRGLCNVAQPIYIILSMKTIIPIKQCHKILVNSNHCAGKACER